MSPERASQDKAASDRDVTAEDRDRAAELRDRDAADRDRKIGDEPGARQEWDRVRSAADRGDSADDRHESALERVEAEHDRGEAKLAAERALEILESMSDAFLTLDAQWQFTYLNPQTEAILDRRREDLLGKNMWHEFPEAIGSGFDIAYHRALREQVAVRFEEHYAPLGRTLEIRVFPVRDGLAVYFTDITRERLRDANERQTQRLEALGNVVAGVAHDFANVINAIAGFASLGKGAADGETIPYFEEIESAGRTANALTSQLLAFGRVQPLSPELIDLNEAVRVISPMLEQLTPNNVSLQLDLSGEPVIVFMDCTQLDQVLMNLVVNSRDAIDGSGTITISTSVGATSSLDGDIDAPFGVLRVTDTGCGISEAVLPNIFDPYFSTKPAGEGTGLGLATIYGIVSQSGGHIAVDSKVGAGTTMTVEFPATEPAVAA